MGTNSSPSSPSPSESVADDTPHTPPRSPSEPCDDFPLSTSSAFATTSGCVAPATPSRPPDAPTNTMSPFARNKSSVAKNPQFNLQASRSAVFDDLGPTVPEVSFNYLTENVLPPLDQNVNIAKVIETLQTNGVIDKETGRWKDFSQDPADEAKDKKEPDLEGDKARSPLEVLVFDRLVNLFSSIIAHSGVERDSTLEYLTKPSNTPISVYAGKGGKPDGHLVFKNRLPPKGQRAGSDRIFWRDLCTPAEFKLRETYTNIRDDNMKICWSMQQIMHEDPRRRFTFAFTIQNATMRIWYASRSEVLVSKPFNFIEDPSKFVHFVLSQAFAEEHQLGVDPTMKVVSMESSGRLVYDVTIRESNATQHIYRTQELINDDATANLRGRGTRVWQMAQVVGEKVNKDVGGVMKDYWIDEDRTREGDILQELRDLYDGHSDEGLFNDLFLTVVAHGDVYIGNQLDNTRQLMTRGVAPPGVDKPENRFPLEPGPLNFEMPSGKSVFVHAGSQQAQDMPADAKLVQSPCRRKHVDYWNKTHYRVLFLQRCKGPLSKETSLTTIFRHLGTVVTAIGLLHECKTPWVHRDISAGNILIDFNDNARLADLEYAKRMDDTRSHHVRTGTLDYMAVEVDQGDYQFITRDPKAVALTKPKPGVMSRKERLHLAHAGKKPKPVRIRRHFSAENTNAFDYNPLHDLESVLWISFDAVVNHERTLASDPNSTAVALSDDEREIAAKLFYNASERQQAMTRQTGGIIDKFLRNLPGPLKPVGESLSALKEALIGRYTELEADPASIGADACGELYDLFDNNFCDITDTLDELGDVVVKPIKVELAHGARKPPRVTQGAARGSSNKRGPADDMSQGSKKQKSTHATA